MNSPDIYRPKKSVTNYLRYFWVQYQKDIPAPACRQVGPPSLAVLPFGSIDVIVHRLVNSPANAG